MQFVQDTPWIERYGIRYALGVDGFFHADDFVEHFYHAVGCCRRLEVIKTRIAGYMAAFLIMSGLTNGVFAALDAVLFYVFWEATLIPLLSLSEYGAVSGEFTPPLNSFYTPGRFFADVDCPVIFIPTVRFVFHRRFSRCAVVANRAKLAVLCFSCRFCGESADDAGAYMAARCAC